MTPQPIETAPRDGRPILAFGLYGNENLTARDTRGWLVVTWVEHEEYHRLKGDPGGWYSETATHDCDRMIATHWVPLPADPT